MKRMHLQILCLITLMFSLTLYSCAGESDVHDDHAPEWLQTELYFGLLDGDGEEILESQWTDFLDSNITPRFPDGLTVLDVYGQYMLSSGDIIKQQTKILLVLHEDTDEYAQKIDTIISEFKALYNLEIVLEVVTKPESVTFK